MNTSQGRGRILFTVGSDAQEHLLGELSSNIITCYHFSGLHFPYEHGRRTNDHNKFYADLTRLAKIAGEERSRVVVLDPISNVIPLTAVDIARHLFEYTLVSALLVCSAKRSKAWREDGKSFERLDCLMIMDAGMEVVHTTTDFLLDSDRLRKLLVGLAEKTNSRITKNVARRRKAA